MAKISIDQTKCQYNEGCRRCLEVCWVGVFLMHSLKPRTREHGPLGFRISPIFDTLCIGCEECVKNCRAEAISVRY